MEIDLYFKKKFYLKLNSNSTLTDEVGHKNRPISLLLVSKSRYAHYS